MSDILARIAAYKREEVAARKRERPTVDVSEAPPGRDFWAALNDPRGRRGRPALIAEVKKASPSKGLIRADFDPPALARAYQKGGAACLSVLTDGPSFQGADEYLLQARAACDLPVLRKDFIVDPWQVRESRALGADCILVILALVEDSLAAEIAEEADSLGMSVLLEVHDEAEMTRADYMGNWLTGINNRDLRTFEVDLGVTERLIKHSAGVDLFVSESGIFTPADVSRVAAAGASAILVGESLMRQADVEAATRALLSGA